MYHNHQVYYPLLNWDIDTNFYRVTILSWLLRASTWESSIRFAKIPQLLIISNTVYNV